MRIAVSGTHGSGKTTLVESFADAHPRYTGVPEPYWDLIGRGVPLSGEPTVDDLQEQLTVSVDTILACRGEPDVIFDRSPFDFIAYLEVLAEEGGDDWTPSGKVLSKIEAALATLDLIVFLPLSEPDEIQDAITYPELRAAVDRRLKNFLGEDGLGLLGQGPPLREIRGTPSERLARLGELAAGKGL